MRELSKCFCNSEILSSAWHTTRKINWACRQTCNRRGRHLAVLGVTAAAAAAAAAVVVSTVAVIGVCGIFVCCESCIKKL